MPICDSSLACRAPHSENPYPRYARCPGQSRRDITTTALGLRACHCTRLCRALLCSRCAHRCATATQQGSGECRRPPRPHHRSRSVLRQRRCRCAFVSRHDPTHAGDVRCARAFVCVFHLRHALGNQRGMWRRARARSVDPCAGTVGRLRCDARCTRRSAVQIADHRSRPPGASLWRERSR